MPWRLLFLATLRVILTFSQFKSHQKPVAEFPSIVLLSKFMVLLLVILVPAAVVYALVKYLKPSKLLPLILLLVMVASFISLAARPRWPFFSSVLLANI